MNTIIIQIKNDEGVENQIFLKETSLQAPNDLSVILVANQSPEFIAAYNAFIAACNPLAPQPLVEYFDVVEPITNLPTDETVSRTVSANIPVRATANVKELVMPVLVRHYRNVIHIPAEFPDIKDVMKATNDNLRPDGQGNMVGEFDFFSALADQIPIKQLMRLQIAEEDAQGRWNPVVPEAPIEG